MRQRRCNIWILDGTHAIVIPTNIGWKGGGRNVMGRGLAKQAKNRCGDVSLIVGRFYQEQVRQWTQESINMRPPIFSAVFRREGKGQDSNLIHITVEEAKTMKEYDWVELVFVPSKKLIHPVYLSWKLSSDLKIVRRSLNRLKKIQTLRPKIAVPLIGAGNGQLNADVVEASIREILGNDDRFTLALPSRRYS